MTAFEIIEEDPKPATRRPKLSEVKTDGSNEDGKIAQHFASLIFATISQRAVAIFSALFTVAGLVLVWWAYMSILADPSDKQLLGAGLLSVFFLALEWVRRR